MDIPTCTKSVCRRWICQSLQIQDENIKATSTLALWQEFHEAQTQLRTPGTPSEFFFSKLAKISNKSFTNRCKLDESTTFKTIQNKCRVPVHSSELLVTHFVSLDCFSNIFITFYYVPQNQTLTNVKLTCSTLMSCYTSS